MTAAMTAAMSARVALLGVGRMGRRHLEAFESLGDACSVASIWDASAAVRGVLASEGRPVAASLDAAIRSADLVVVATPTATHYDLAVRALIVASWRAPVAERRIVVTTTSGTFSANLLTGGDDRRRALVAQAAAAIALARGEVTILPSAQTAAALIERAALGVAPSLVG